MRIWRQLGGLMRRLGARTRTRRTSGSAAVEFALVAPPFFLILFAIFETGIVFFANSTLDNAVTDASRLIRTGQVQGGAMNQAQFRDFVCARIQSLMRCDENLRIDVRSFSNFSGAGFQPPLDENGNLRDDLNSFSPGGAGEVVLVRVFYTWKLAAPIFSKYFANMSGDRRLISSATAFRNEPFGAMLN